MAGNVGINFDCPSVAGKAYVGWSQLKSIGIFTLF